MNSAELLLYSTDRRHSNTSKEHLHKIYNMENSFQNNNNNEISFDSSYKNVYPLNDAKLSLEPALLLKVQESYIESPSRMIAELTNIKNGKNSPILENLSDDETQSSVTSFTAVIEDLDGKIKNNETANRQINFKTKALLDSFEKICPVMEEQITPDKTYYAKFKNCVTREMVSSMENCLEDDDGKEEFEEDEKSIDYDDETSRRASRKVPIMESTRKSSFTDSTKIIFSSSPRVDANTISIIGIPVTSETFDCQYDELIEFEESALVINDTLPPEVEDFLENALGDELFNCTTVTNATYEAIDRTNLNCTSRELLRSGNEAHFQERIAEVLATPTIETTSRRNSSTFDRTMTIYRSLSQRIKKKLRPGFRTKESSPTDAPMLPTGISETARIRELLQDVNVQQTMMKQATKALNLCKVTKEFSESSERIEFERILLLASLQRKFVIEEIKRITSDRSEYEKNVNDEIGEVTINNMSLNLRGGIEWEENENETLDYWFVLIITQGLRVWATRPMCYQMKNSKIRFSDTISIPDLLSNFKIQIEVYSLKSRRTAYSHDEKYRIRKNKRTNACLSCPSMRARKKIERTYLSSNIHEASKNKTTSFVLSGFIELFLHDLSLSPPWPLMLVPANSILEGTMDLNLACRLHLTFNHEGFVNHGDEAGGFAIWNRRWCVLKGHTLMFWNYPREQETKVPLTIIDLINCVSEQITTADRTICAKPRTLLFETARRKSASDRNSMIVECRTARTIVRNLISLDSLDELTEWSVKLNEVIKSLREWNVICTKNESQVSDL